MKKITLITVMIVMTLSLSLSADVITSLYLKQGHNNNLFADSYGISDFYNTIGGEVALYPSSFAQITINGDYNVYYTNTDLSNFNGGASFTLIPTSDSSKLSLILSGSAGKRNFGELYNIYNNNSLNGDLYLIYKFSNRLSFKTSGYYSYVGYDNADEVTDEYFGFSAGLNLTFLKNNSLDFETFIYQKKYNSDLIDLSGNSSQTYDFIDYKVRYSRPLGERWGTSLNYTFHNLKSYDAYTISGYTIDYLSPWNSLWNGHSASLSLKHYLKNQSILELSAGYTDKEYVSSFDYTDIDNNFVESFQRNDQVTQIDLKYYKSFYLENSMITPVLSVGYTQNSSSLALYDYNSFNIALASTFSF